jgi:hypothetical protein
VGDRRCGERVVERGNDGGGLQRQRDVRVGSGERVCGAIQHRDRLPEALGAAEREPEHEAVDARCRSGGGGVDRLLQVLGPPGQPGARLGHSQVEQQRRPVGRRRWFGERTAKEDGLRLRRAVLPRRAGGLDQTLDGPAVSGGLADQQVLGDAR